MNTRASALLSSGVALSGRIVNTALQLVYTILINRYLGPELAGVFFIAFSAVRIAALLASLGLDDGLIKFVAKHRVLENWGSLLGTAIGALAVGCAASLAMAGTMAILVSRLAALMASESGSLINTLRVMLLSIPFYVLFWLSTAGLQALRKILVLTALRDVLQPLLMLVTARGVVLMKLDSLALSWAYVGALALLALIAVLAFWLAIRRLPSAPVVWDLRGLLRFSAPVLLGNLFRTCSGWIDPVVLGVVLPAAQVAAYFTAQRASLLIVLVLGAVNLVISPWVARFVAKNDREGLRHIFSRSVEWVLAGTIPLFVAVTLFHSEIMALLGGEPMAADANAFLILAAGQLVNAGTGSVARVLVMSGKQVVECVNAALHTLLTIVALLVGSHWGGLLGAAIGSASVLALINIAKVIEVQVLVGVCPYTRRHLWIVLISVLAACLSYQVYQFVRSIRMQVVAQSTAFGLTFILVYSALMWHLLFRTYWPTLRACFRIRNQPPR